MTQKEIDTYLKKIKRNCPFPFKKKLLAELREDLVDYKEEHPDGTMDDVIARFGAPETFSYNYVLVMENEARQKMIKKSRRTKAVFLVVVLLWLIALTVKLVGDVREHSSHAGYYYDFIVEEDDMEGEE